jgi:hypothetical protein
MEPPVYLPMFLFDYHLKNFPVSSVTTKGKVAMTEVQPEAGATAGASSTALMLSRGQVSIFYVEIPIRFERLIAHCLDLNGHK